MGSKLISGDRGSALVEDLVDSVDSVDIVFPFFFNFCFFGGQKYWEMQFVCISNWILQDVILKHIFSNNITYI